MSLKEGESMEEEVKPQSERRPTRHMRHNDREFREEHGIDTDPRHDHSTRHVEEYHRHDLFDFEDPMTDSDYDDLDEETGIYHDEDPYMHSSHHVKRHHSEEQYYHSRERYYPEDAYHAAGTMKYDVIHEDELVAHALGKEHIKEEPVPVPAPTPAPIPVPAP